MAKVKKKRPGQQFIYPILGWRTIVWALIALTTCLVSGLLIQRFQVGGHIETFLIHTIGVGIYAEKSDVLAFAAVMLAIQFPLFLEYLKSLKSSGILDKRILPQVTDYKQNLAVIVVCVGFMLAANGESWLLAPVILFTIFSLLIVYRAITMMFYPERFQKKIADFVEDKTKRNVAQLVELRKKANAFRNRLEKYKNIEIGSHLIIEDNPSGWHVLRASQAGRLADIDLGIIDASLRKLKAENLVQLNTTSSADEHVQLLVYPPFEVQIGNEIAAIPIWSEADRKAAKNIEDAIIKSLSFSNIKNELALGDIFSDMKQQLKVAMRTDDEYMFKNVSLSLDVVMNNIDSALSGSLGKGYTVENAYDELPILGDQISRLVHDMSDIVDDVIEDIVRNNIDNQTADALVVYIYHRLYEAADGENRIGVARYNKALINMLVRYVLAGNNDSQVAKHLLGIIREDFSYMLPYKTDKNEIYYQLTQRRIDDVRNLMIHSFRRKSQYAFNDLLKSLGELLSPYKEKVDKELKDRARSSIIALACYIDKHSDEEGVVDYYQTIIKCVASWGQNAVYSAVIEFYDENYLDKWRIESMDLPADGEMHSVPNLNGNLRKVWTDIIVARKEWRVPAVSDKLKSTSFFFGAGDGNADTAKWLEEAGIKSDSDHYKELRSIINTLAKAHKDEMDKAVIGAPLSDSRVKQFENNVLGEYNGNLILNELILPIKKRVSVPKSKDKFIEIGYNTIFDKEPFIELDNWPVFHDIDIFSKDMGRNIAATRNRHIVGRLITQATQSNDELERFVKKLSHETEYAVIAYNLREWDFYEQYGEHLVEDKLTLNNMKFKGINQNEPINFIYDNSTDESGLLFVESGKIGQILYYNPDSDDIIIRKIIDLSSDDDERNKLIAHQPDWLKNISKDEGLQQSYLKKKVILIALLDMQLSISQKNKLLFLKIQQT